MRRPLESDAPQDGQRSTGEPPLSTTNWSGARSPLTEWMITPTSGTLAAPITSFVTGTSFIAGTVGSPQRPAGGVRTIPNPNTVTLPYLRSSLPGTGACAGRHSEGPHTRPHPTTPPTKRPPPHAGIQRTVRGSPWPGTSPPAHCPATAPDNYA